MKKIFTIDNGKLVPLRYKEIHKENSNKVVKERFKIRFFADIGMMTVLPLIGGSILGSFLDNKLSTKPILTLVFLTFGFFIAIFNIYKLFKDLT